MSTPPDQLAKLTRKTSVGEVLTAINAAEAASKTTPPPKGGKPADAAKAEALAAAKQKYAADKLALENGDLKKLPASAPVGLKTEYDAVVGARSALPADPKTPEELAAANLKLAALAEQLRLYLAAAAALAASKQSFEASLASLKTALDTADAAKTEKQLALEQAKAEYEKKLAAMKDLVAQGKYVDAARALAAAGGVGDTAKSLNALVDKYAACRKLLYVDGKADREYLYAIERNSPPSDQTRDALAKYKVMMRLYHSGQYGRCMEAFKDLQKGMAALKKAVAEADKLATPKAKEAAKKFEKLAGGKKLSSLGTSDTAKLVVELKKLPLSEQSQMLADLHGPSTKLDAEGRLMQRAMYKAMTLDEGFKKEDKKKRDAYRSELKEDAQIQDAVEDWNAQDDKGNDKVSKETKQKVFEKVLAVQSKTYGIPVPAIRWYDGDEGDFGGFNTTSGIISLNTRYLFDAEEMINTILHENSHNYQDQLAKRFFAGEIKKDDPVYEQARAFALTHHMDAYVDSDEDSAVYKVQPEEMHAWDAGDVEAPALLTELRQARQKRNAG